MKAEHSWLIARNHTREQRAFHYGFWTERFLQFGWNM